MIQFPRSSFRQLRTVQRRCFSRPLPHIQFLAGPDGLVVRSQQEGIAVAYQTNPTQGNSQLLLPAQALEDLEGRGQELVALEPGRNGKVTARWTDAGVPRVVEYESAADALPEFPKAPGRFVEQDAGSLKALDDAMQTASKDSVRLSTNKIQLRGRAGVISATDGRQLLWSSGFRFPFTDDLLVPRVTVFGCRELTGDVRIGNTTTHVCVQVGAWTIYLPIDKEGRFPRVESIIPNPTTTGTTFQLAQEDAAFLTKALPRLPGEDNEFSPVTLDLNGQFAVRARDAEQGRSTEVILARSNASGKVVRYAINRQYVSRAINLGFTDGHVLNVETPILFQDERRKYVVMGLGKGAGIAPSDKDLRLRSDSAEASNHSQPHERRTSPVKPAQRFSTPEPEAETTNGNATSNGQHHAKVGFNGLLEEAQSIQNGLRDLLLRTNQLLAGLKAYRRHAKTMQSTLASLRQLQQVEA